MKLITRYNAVNHIIRDDDVLETSVWRGYGQSLKKHLKIFPFARGPQAAHAVKTAAGARTVWDAAL